MIIFFVAQIFLESDFMFQKLSVNSFTLLIMRLLNTRSLMNYPLRK